MVELFILILLEVNTMNDKDFSDNDNFSIIVFSIVIALTYAFIKLLYKKLSSYQCLPFI